MPFTREQIEEVYPNAECPDCGEEIPSKLVGDGDECKNCGHVFWITQEGACPDRAAFGSCTHPECAESDEA